MSVPGQLTWSPRSNLAPYVFRLQQSIGCDVSSVPINTLDGSSYTLVSGDVISLILSETKASSPYYSGVSTAIDVSGNTATFTFTSGELLEPGHYIGKMTIHRSGTTPVKRISCYAEIEPDLLSTNDVDPLTIDEVRNSIMDRGSLDNRLLDTTEFEDGDIVRAMFTVIGFWNENVYPDQPAYSVISFPYREHLLTGILGKMYMDKGQQLMRNIIPIAAEGLQADDSSNRAKFYLDKGKALWDEWMSWCVAEIKRDGMASWIGDSRSRHFW